MSKSKGLFTSISIEQENISNETELSLDNSNTQVEDTSYDDMQEREENINNDIKNLNNETKVLDVLDSQLQKNREKLKDEKKINLDDVIESQEALTYALVNLGYNKSEINAIRISYESFDRELYKQLVVSTETITNIIKKVFDNICNIIIAIGEKLKEYITRMIFIINSKETILIKYNEFCRSNSDVLLPSLDKKQIENICRRFNIFISVFEDKLHIPTMLDFTSVVKENPFLNNTKDFFNYNTNMVNYEENLKRLVEKIETSAKTNYMQTKIKKYIKNRIIELQDPDSLLYTTYVRKSTIKGFVLSKNNIKYETFHMAHINIRTNFAIDETRKFGDLMSITKKILDNCSSMSSYFKHLLFLQKESLNDLKKAYKNYNYENSDSNENVVIKNTMELIKDIGTDMIYDLIMQRYYMVKDLIYLIDTYISTYKKKVS